jgi:hypothetical protein
VIAIHNEEDNHAIATTSDSEPPVDESHDKENGSADPQSIQTSTSCSSSPRKTPPLQSSRIVVDNQDDSSVTSSVESEPKAAQIPATDSYMKEVATPQSVEPSPEDDPVPNIRRSVGDVLVSDWEDNDESMMNVDCCVPEKPKELAVEASSASIEASNENPPSVETVHLTCTLKTDDGEICVTDVISLTTPAVIHLTEESQETNIVKETSEQQQY